MAWSMTAAIWALLLLLVLANAAADDLTADLVNRRAASADGVIKLDDASVRHLAPVSGRPYAMLVFFDSVKLKDKSPELKLGTLRSDFALAAQAYARSNPAGTEGNTQLFFCTLEFDHSQASFASFGVQSLPHIRFLAAGSSQLSSSEALEMQDMHAEGMLSFLRSRIKYQVGQVIRPPLLSQRQMATMVAALAVAAPYVVRRVASSKNTVFHDRRVWCAGALFVYFFSVSGGMFNIIRKMPLFVADRNDPSKLVFFYQGSGMQLGVEGFIAGYLYTMLGLLLAFVTQLLPGIKSSNFQRLAMLGALFAGFWTVRKVVSLDNWKTGYGVHYYLPKSWR